MSFVFCLVLLFVFFFFFQAEDGIRDWSVTGVQTCALPICSPGQVLCTNFYGPGQYTYFAYTNGVNEQFIDPQCGQGVFIGTDTVIWEYVFDIPTNTCWQTKDRKSVV